MQNRSEIESLDQEDLKSLIKSVGDSSSNWRTRKRWIIGFAGVLALIGIVFEFLQDRDSDLKELAQARLSSLQSDASELAIAQANRGTEEARKDAAEANLLAKSHESKIAESNRIAESERLARVRLEEKVAWRSLSEAEQVSLGEELKSFSGQHADCSFLMSDMEAFSFSSDIAAALRNGNWRVIPPSPFMITMMSINPPTTDSPIEKVSTGVAVWNTKDSGSAAAAFALVSELQKRGFDARYLPPPSEVPSIPTVSIIVEHRPEGPQGEAKLLLQ